MGKKALKGESQEWNQGEINLEGQPVAKAMAALIGIYLETGRGEQGTERARNPRSAT